MSVKEVKPPLQTLGMTGTKWDFFVAAINLFAAKGYNNVAVREIAAAINIKAASMYNHFANKNELLLQIYDFFQINYDALLPDVNQMLSLIPHTPYQDVLKQLKIPTAHDPHQLMIKIMHILIEERNYDSRAHELAHKVFTVVPRFYVKTVLSKMVELQVIKPLNIDAMAALFAGLDLHALYVYETKFALGDDNWAACHEFLLDIIQPTNRFPRNV